MAESGIIAPIIHLNGDCKETIMGNLKRAIIAVHEAIGALQACSGNERNFYPDPGRLERYQAQHKARSLHLRTVKQSLIDEAKAITRDNPGR